MGDTKTLPKRQNKDKVARSVMAILMDGENDDMKKAPTQTLIIGDLVPYAAHPFRLYEGARLDDMVRSIRENGVIVPIVVRPLDNAYDTYEILSGHNRVNAAKLAGLTRIPAVVKEGLTDQEAALIVTETNLVQRSFADLSHSERAVALKYHLNAIKEQGKRTDLLDEIKTLTKSHEIKENGTSGLKDPKLEARDKTAGKYGLDARTVSRYVRLCELSEPILNRMDNDEIGLYPAVSLSYLSPDEQAELDRLLSETAFKVDMKKAETLREFSKAKKLTADKMLQILSGEHGKKPKPKTAPAFKLKAAIYSRYFSPDAKPGEIEEVIAQALAEYFENHKEKEAAV